MRCRGVALALVVCAAVACRGAEGEVGVRDGDAVLFAERVQPVLARYCAYLACHGREGMPLTVFAVDFLRLRDPEGVVDPLSPVLDERALSPREIELNRLATAARVRPTDRSGGDLWRRLVPVEAGGIPHAAIVVFESEDDPDLSAIREFLETVHVQ